MTMLSVRPLTKGLRSLLIIAVFWAGKVQGQSLQGDQEGLSLEASPLLGVANVALLDSDNTQASGIPQLLTKRDSASGSRPAFAGGFEVGGAYDWTSGHRVWMQARVVSVSLNRTQQSGWDTFSTLGYGFAHQVHRAHQFEVDIGVRARGWLMQEGKMPSSGHMGAIIAAHYRLHGLHLLGEWGLMGLNVGVPERLGVQRDSSTLRLRIGYRIAHGRNLYSEPWIEVFHTHRSFYGSRVQPLSPGFFWDQALASMGWQIGWRD